MKPITRFTLGIFFLILAMISLLLIINGEFGIIYTIITFIICFPFFLAIGYYAYKHKFKLELLIEKMMKNAKNINLKTGLPDRIQFYKIALFVFDNLKDEQNLEKNSEYQLIKNEVIEMFESAMKINKNYLLKITNEKFSMYGKNFLSIGSAIEQLNIQDEINDKNVENYIRLLVDLVEAYKIIISQLALLIAIINNKKDVEKYIDIEDWPSLKIEFETYKKGTGTILLWPIKYKTMRNARYHKGKAIVDKNKQEIVFMDRKKPPLPRTYKDLENDCKYAVMWLMAFAYGQITTYLKYHEELSTKI